jgi:hypothetical protein
MIKRKKSSQDVIDALKNDDGACWFSQSAFAPPLYNYAHQETIKALVKKGLIKVLKTQEIEVENTNSYNVYKSKAFLCELITNPQKTQTPIKKMRSFFCTTENGKCVELILGVNIFNSEKEAVESFNEKIKKDYDAAQNELKKVTERIKSLEYKMNNK